MGVIRSLLLPAAAVAGMAVGAAGGLLRVAPAEPEPLRLEIPSPEATPLPPFILVHLSGAVWQPGLVRLREGARLAQAIEEAGGARADADLARVNLARRLRDEEHVHVPSLSERGAAVRSDPLPPPGPLDLNAASQAELETLPGIGPALARRIVARREETGGFLYVEELLEVRGIGQRLLAELEGLVTVP